ncbi:unnamed protein product [Pipistrellus nathusii]|uniref:Uncharacterized protein n=1 Tax=Pipistrellus nathusii TaxID=59473 RepID=A0ABN9ZDM8_PIPNA
MAGFQLVVLSEENFSRSKRNLLFKKKESTGQTESKSVPSVLPRSRVTGDLWVFVERRAHVFAGIYMYLFACVLGIMDSLLVAGDFLCRRSLATRDAPRGIEKTT